MEFNATFIAAVISFIIFATIMNLVFYKPLQKIVSERQKFLDETSEDAKIAREKADAILKDKEEKLEKTRHEAKKVILNKSEDAKAKKSVMTSSAREKANKEVESAKDVLKKSHDEAQNVLTQESQKLADVISAKILGKV